MVLILCKFKKNGFSKFQSQIDQFSQEIVNQFHQIHVTWYWNGWMGEGVGCQRRGARVWKHQLLQSYSLF